MIYWIILKGLEIIRNNNLSSLKLIIITFLYILIPIILLILLEAEIAFSNKDR